VGSSSGLVKPTSLKENTLTENPGPLNSGVVRRFGSSHTNTYLVVNFKEILVDYEELGIVRILSRPLVIETRETRRRMMGAL
jgi:hypothetical protein